MSGYSVQLDDELVHIQVGEATLEGNLTVPPDAIGIVLFAHGSGSSRFSPRNRHVARLLQDANLGTLLIDLLTNKEEQSDRRTLRKLVFSIGMLADRLVAATDWLARNAVTSGSKIGYFGASTGAAAALLASTKRSGDIHAIVSRGGRPDMASDILPKVKAPTLLIVGGEDIPVISLNKEALELLTITKSLKIVPGAGHLFEEPGKLDIVADMAANWFRRYFSEEKKL